MTTRYRTIVILIAITVLAYLSVDIFYRAVNARLAGVKTGITVTKKADIQVVKKQPLNFYNVISERNLFGSIDKVAGERYIDVDELESTKLNLALLGTVSGTGKFDCAVIEEKDKRKQGLFKTGDTVASATVVRIMRGVVVLRVDGRDEILAMDKPGKDRGDSGKPTSGAGSSVVVNKAEINEALKDMSKILSQARIRPYFSAGKSNGFIISSIKSGSIFQKMGMQNGDIIQSVNDRPIKSPDEMLKLYNSLKSGSSINLNIKRRGRQEELKYIFR